MPSEVEAYPLEAWTIDWSPSVTGKYAEAGVKRDENARRKTHDSEILLINAAKVNEGSHNQEMLWAVALL